MNVACKNHSRYGNEQLIGQAASRGCIRMRNQDIIQLFDLIDVGTEVEILP